MIKVIENRLNDTGVRLPICGFITKEILVYCLTINDFRNIYWMLRTPPHQPDQSFSSACRTFRIWTHQVHQNLKPSLSYFWSCLVSLTLIQAFPYEQDVLCMYQIYLSSSSVGLIVLATCLFSDQSILLLLEIADKSTKSSHDLVFFWRQDIKPLPFPLSRKFLPETSPFNN